MIARIALSGTSLLVASLLLTAGAPLASGQSSLARGAMIDGVVTDTNLVSLADAAATILGSKIRVATGANGRFRILDIPAGDYVLVVHRLGYVPASTSVHVAEHDTLRLAVSLERIVNALDTVVVAAKALTARLSEFEERRKAGQGQFMTQSQIESRNATDVNDLLRTFTAVTITTSGLAINFRSGIIRTCPFDYYVDGVLVSLIKLDMALPRPKELAGIEVYDNTATIPLQYKRPGGGAMCGVILLWTRSGR